VSDTDPQMQASTPGTSAPPTEPELPAVAGEQPFPVSAEAPAAPLAETALQTEAAGPRSGGILWGTGRRKSSVARVRIRAGSGDVLINGRKVEEFFTEPQDRADVLAPLDATSTTRHFDVFVNVAGGGHSGQAGAIRLGISRALVRADGRHEPTLRDKGYLTRDSRRVERKKYGRRKARRRFQFSKR